MNRFRSFVFLVILAWVSTVFGQQSFQSVVGNVPVGPVLTGQTQVPFILWGGDVSTFVANGGLITTKDSIYGTSGLNIKLTPADDFTQQVKDYLSGKSPYLRCTTHMLGMASEVINQDARTKPVVFMQMTWSGGDHIVSRPTIKTLNDLKGKKVALQQGGPHLGLLDDSLKAVGLTWKDITVVWTKDITGINGPAELMRKDPSIDAACVITPDMLGLCSGIDQHGSGAEGTLEGSHVVNSTATMSRSIADVYVVRSDYYKSNKAEVEKFFIGYCKATENLISWKAVYADGKGKSPEYMSALKMAQTIYGQEILPSLEVDAHGLISDATFVRIPGNESFFSDPNNLTGFVSKQTNALDLAISLEYSKQKLGWDKAEWDYKSVSDAVGVKYVEPVMATGRIKVEVSDFGADLDDSTIFSFEIKFEPEQTTFSADTYAADFQRVAQQSQTFGNAVILIRGHSDPTLTLQNFFWAAKAKGLMTGDSGNYKFNGKSLDLSNTVEITSAIQSTNLSGQQRKNSSGQMVSIDDPRTTAAAALQLSQTRAFSVKNSIEQYAKAHGLTIDLSQIQPVGVGISEPINPRPRNIQQAKENMRVEFRVIRVKAESLSADDFNFEEE